MQVSFSMFITSSCLHIENYLTGLQDCYFQTFHLFRVFPDTIDYLLHAFLGPTLFKFRCCWCRWSTHSFKKTNLSNILGTYFANFFSFLRFCFRQVWQLLNFFSKKGFQNPLFAFWKKMFPDQWSWNILNLQLSIKIVSPFLEIN